MINTFWQRTFLFGTWHVPYLIYSENTLSIILTYVEKNDISKRPSTSKDDVVGMESEFSKHPDEDIKEQEEIPKVTETNTSDKNLQ